MPGVAPIASRTPISCFPLAYRNRHHPADADAVMHNATTAKMPRTIAVVRRERQPVLTDLRHRLHISYYRIGIDVMRDPCELLGRVPATAASCG